MSLDVSRIVDVQISVSPLALQRAGFGILNIVGTSDVIPIAERVRSYNNIDEVGVDFASTDEEYIAASIFFSQVPRPSELYISRRATEDQPATLFGSSTDVETDLSVWQAESDGELAIDVDGTPVEMLYLDFSTVTSMSDVAAVFNASTTSIDTEWDGSRFIFTASGIVGDDTIGYVEAPGIGGTYIGELTGAEETDSGSRAESKIVGETISESLNAIEAINSKWYGLAFTKEVRDDSQTDKGTQADCLDAAAWAEARTKTFWNNSSDENTLITGNTTNISYLLSQLEYSRTATVYNAGDYPAISMFARGATVDFSGTNTTITYKFKQLPGITVDDLSATQANNIIAVNCNYYTQFGTQLSGDAVSILAEGVMANGRFADEVVGIDWLQNSLQTDVFNYLFQSTTKIPQTDEGVDGIAQVMSGVLDQAVANGLAAPGNVTIDNDTVFLPKGYEIFQGLVEDQSQADREARKAPPIGFVIKGAGAIHEVTITGTFVR
jgi:hypothetical protein